MPNCRNSEFAPTQLLLFPRRHRRRTGDLSIDCTVGLVINLPQNATRPDPRIAYGGKRAAESRYRRHRRLLLEIFVVSDRKNSGGEFFGGWLPLDAPLKVDHVANTEKTSIITNGYNFQSILYSENPSQLFQWVRP